MSTAALVFFAIAAIGVLLFAFEASCLARVRRRVLPPPSRWPSISLIKPLRGLDDELEENLESHARLDYPGEWEILLGVRDEEDPALPIARAFAARYPGRARVVIQDGAPGHNPKVNQLITLTREARHEVIALTDSNVRVPPQHLREVASMLALPEVGLATHLFIGWGERRVGAILDNLALATFCAPTLAAGEVALGMDEVVGKSLAIRREVLERIGDWHEFQDVLAEDQRMGRALRAIGLHARLCPTPVFNVQVNQGFSAFWARHSRWAMIRSRVLLVVSLLEWMVNPIVPALVGLALAGGEAWAWGTFGAIAVVNTAVVQFVAVVARGEGFRPMHLLLAPVMSVLYFCAWLRGHTLREIEWRGTRLRVLKKTRLAAPETVARARKLQKRKSGTG